MLEVSSTDEEALLREHFVRDPPIHCEYLRSSVFICGSQTLRHEALWWIPAAADFPDAHTPTERRRADNLAIGSGDP